jgi:hypothetical protein
MGNVGLTKLCELIDRQASVVELRFLAGLTEGEAAKVLDVSTSVDRRGAGERRPRRLIGADDLNKLRTRVPKPFETVPRIGNEVMRAWYWGSSWCKYSAEVRDVPR